MGVIFGKAKIEITDDILAKVMKYDSATTVTEYIRIAAHNVRLIGLNEDCPLKQYMLMFKEETLENFLPYYWKDMMQPKVAILHLIFGTITEEHFIKYWPLILPHREGLEEAIEVALSHKDMLSPRCYELIKGTKKCQQNHTQ